MPTKEESAKAAAEAAMITQSRKLGNGFALALRVGVPPTAADSDLHMTLCYFNNCKRGYEQDLVKSMATEYFQSKNITSIDLVLAERHAERSIRVKGVVVEQIVKDLAELYSNSFSVVPNQIPHVDLRGHSEKDIQTKGVSVIDNWLH